MEAHTGVDWEWLIGNHRQGWRRYAVQAKKVGPDPAYSYRGLRQPVNVNKGGVVRRREQLDILREYASRKRAAPLYCFYNFVQKSSYQQFWHCCQSTVQPKQFGCTVTPAYVVEWATNDHSEKPRRSRRKFDPIHERTETVPWRCLTLCPYLSSGGSGRVGDPSHGFSTDEGYSEQLPRDLAALFDELPPWTLDEVYDSVYADVSLIPARVMFVDSTFTDG